MQWYPKKVLVTVAVLGALWITTSQAQESGERLVWKNGDVLPGKLLGSEPGQVRWSSPYFLDDLVVDTEVLDSIIFPKQSVQPTEAFRVGTVSGDVFRADLVGLDEDTFVFSSKRYGQVQVNRDVIYSLNRLANPNLAFDGSQFSDWNVDYGGATRLHMDITDATGKIQLLSGENKESGWHQGNGGYPVTNYRKASIFTEIEMPKQFEIDLEFASSESPRFVLAIGKDELSAASDQSFRLETWDNELVAIQGTVFEPVMTIEEDQRDVRLRLAFDSISGELEVLDSNGRLLVNIQGVQPTTGESGLFIRNRGDDLTVRRLSVYRQSAEGTRQLVDSAKARVHLINGQIVYGRLYVESGSAYVVDQDGTRRNVDLEKVDRIASPDVKLATTANLAELTYADGAMVRGRIEQANSDQVIVRTAFSDTPVTCALAGAALLRFGPAASEAKSPSSDMDQLFSASGRLRGRLSFDLAESPLSWRPEGAVKSLRLADTVGARVERNSKFVTKGPSFDEKAFPSVLHLKNGEIIPCQVSSYNENTLSFQSPFIKGRKIDSTYLKAIEFKPSKSPELSKESSRELDDWDYWLTEILGPEQRVAPGIDPVKLDRALTVPRFKRDNPPSHILMANTGDLMRGSLLGISGQMVQFESKLRELAVPINRVARVVDVSKPEEDPDKPAVVNDAPDVKGRVRVTLAHGSILVFEPLESKDGKLLGHSPIYGEMAVPVDSIQHLHFGNYESESFKSVFEEWVVRPGKEPEFGGD